MFLGFVIENVPYRGHSVVDLALHGFHVCGGAAEGAGADLGVGGTTLGLGQLLMGKKTFPIGNKLIASSSVFFSTAVSSGE